MKTGTIIAGIFATSVVND